MHTKHATVVNYFYLQLISDNTINILNRTQIIIVYNIPLLQQSQLTKVIKSGFCSTRKNNIQNLSYNVYCVKDTHTSKRGEVYND